jgi:hypothetical protein
MNLLLFVRRLSLALLALGLLGAQSATPQSATPQSATPQAVNAPPSPPPFMLLRVDEDYSYLREPDAPHAPLDALKFIPFSSDGEVFLSLGGEMRHRVELAHQPNWGKATEDDAVWLQRYMLHGDLHLGEHVRAFLQFKSGLEFGRFGGPTPVDEDRFDVHLAFVDLHPWADKHIFLRVGRQELQFGAARFVGVREGANIRLNFDGVLARLGVGAWDLQAFVTRPVTVELGAFDDNWMDTQGFWGLYAVHPLFGGGVDLYYLGFANSQARYLQGQGREQRHSLGTRLWGKHGGWDYNVDAVTQVGRFNGEPLLAWALDAETGFTFTSLPLMPRLGLMADITSGDRDLADPSLQTFNSLFPRGGYFGEIPLIGLPNIASLHPSLRVRPLKTFVISAEWTALWRQSDDDGIYGPGQNLVRPALEGLSRQVGHQFNLITMWDITRHLRSYVTYSHFFPGSFIQATGDAQDIDFVQIEGTVRF